ncbi:hypothetical protein P692DRAFT_20209937 [Suillus brevipes Sb2]|nr:hypothetical protein P692DRAFT_20209937 [Suillus brevipes Sb2]
MGLSWIQPSTRKRLKSLWPFSTTGFSRSRGKYRYSKFVITVFSTSLRLTILRPFSILSLAIAGSLGDWCLFVVNPINDSLILKNGLCTTLQPLVCLRPSHGFAHNRDGKKIAFTCIVIQ